jgi:hypothetical protein
MPTPNESRPIATAVPVLTPDFFSSVVVVVVVAVVAAGAAAGAAGAWVL